MKAKHFRRFTAVIAALAVAIAPLLNTADSYAGSAPAAKTHEQVAAPLNLPEPQWPFPCTQFGDCHPHWFYLVNGATVTADQPLVITVTGNFPGANGSFPYPQPEAENGVIEPSVPVGTSGSGLTLQPRNPTPYADNQMWYAKETTESGTNPSFIVSSLPR